jgi:hypothetical protein
MSRRLPFDKREQFASLRRPIGGNPMAMGKVYPL